VELARRVKITSAGISMVESGRRSVNSRWLHGYSAVLGHEER
jgi:hypothetical protein